MTAKARLRVLSGQKIHVRPKDIFDFCTHVILVGMERTIAYFGQDKSVLGADLQ
jgi:hypothetical protein